MKEKIFLNSLIFGLLCFLIIFSGCGREKDFFSLCQTGRAKEVSKAIKKGANVNEKDKDGVTPLMKAKWNNDVKVIKTLIQAGANVNDRDNNSGATPLIHFAWQNTNVEAIKALIEAGAKVNDRDNNDLTPLMYAARDNTNLEVVKSLIDAGANVNDSTKQGFSVISFSSENPNEEIGNYLKFLDVN